jgi:hypothetical protein
MKQNVVVSGAAVSCSPLHHYPDCLLHLALGDQVIPTDLNPLPNHGDYSFCYEVFILKTELNSMKYQTTKRFLLQLVVMIGIRKSLDFVFTKKELQVCIPGSHA